MPPPDVCEHTAAQFDRVPEAKMQFLWQSCLRLLDGDWRC